MKITLSIKQVEYILSRMTTTEIEEKLKGDWFYWDALKTWDDNCGECFELTVKEKKDE